MPLHRRGPETKGLVSRLYVCIFPKVHSDRATANASVFCQKYDRKTLSLRVSSSSSMFPTLRHLIPLTNTASLYHPLTPTIPVPLPGLAASSPASKLAQEVHSTLPMVKMKNRMKRVRVDFYTKNNTTRFLIATGRHRSANRCRLHLTSPYTFLSDSFQIC